MLSGVSLQAGGHCPGPPVCLHSCKQMSIYRELTEQSEAETGGEVSAAASLDVKPKHMIVIKISPVNKTLKSSFEKKQKHKNTPPCCVRGAFTALLSFLCNVHGP